MRSFYTGGVREGFLATGNDVGLVKTRGFIGNLFGEISLFFFLE